MAKHPKAVLTLRVEGPGVRSGSITVPDLIKICDAAQSAINRQAQAMQDGQSLGPGPYVSRVYDECTLELIGIARGSTMLPFRIAKPQQPLPGSQTFGVEVVTRVACVVRAVSGSRNGHVDGLDAGVLDSLKKMGEIFDRKEISAIEWRVPRHEGTSAIKAVFNKKARDRVIQKMTAPAQQPLTVEGTLEMADFKETGQQCRIHPPIGQAISCTFEPGRADEVYRALRKPVRITGTARINPNTGRTEELQIEKISLLEPLLVGERDFFANRSFEKLARAQGVKPLTNPRRLAGGWPENEDLDQFLEEIYQTRSA